MITANVTGGGPRKLYFTARERGMARTPRILRT
jgi:hypothetical protein